MIGTRFGSLVVTSLAHIGRERVWLCTCDCGNICRVTEAWLVNGYRQTCGDAVQIGAHLPIGSKPKTTLERHHLTQREYHKISAAQKHKCKICGKEGTPRLHGDLPLMIDHDPTCCSKGYSCGKCIRGLLCNRCKQALGLFNNSVETLQKAIKHLQCPSIPIFATTDTKPKSST